MPDIPDRAPIGFDLSRVAAIKEELDAQRRKPGRPKKHHEQRERVEVLLPASLVTALDAATDNRTTFIEAAVREKLAANEPATDAASDVVGSTKV